MYLYNSFDKLVIFLLIYKFRIYDIRSFDSIPSIKLGYFTNELINIITEDFIILVQSVKRNIYKHRFKLVRKYIWFVSSTILLIQNSCKDFIIRSESCLNVFRLTKLRAFPITNRLCIVIFLNNLVCLYCSKLS